MARVPAAALKIGPLHPKMKYTKPKTYKRPRFNADVQGECYGRPLQRAPFRQWVDRNYLSGPHTDLKRIVALFTYRIGQRIEAGSFISLRFL